MVKNILKKVCSKEIPPWRRSREAGRTAGSSSKSDPDAKYAVQMLLHSFFTEIIISEAIILEEPSRRALS